MKASAYSAEGPAIDPTETTQSAAFAASFAGGAPPRRYGRPGEGGLAPSSEDPCAGGMSSSVIRACPGDETSPLVERAEWAHCSGGGLAEQPPVPSAAWERWIASGCDGRKRLFLIDDVLCFPLDSRSELLLQSAEGSMGVTKKSCEMDVQGFQGDVFRSPGGAAIVDKAPGGASEMQKDGNQGSLSSERVQRQVQDSQDGPSLQVCPQHVRSHFQINGGQVHGLGAGPRVLSVPDCCYLGL